MSRAVNFKSDVRLDSLSPEICKALIEVYLVYEGLRLSDFCVTSGRDGMHGVDSLHYFGNALDFRTRHLTPEQRISFHNATEKRLRKISEFYDVVLEHSPPHLHVEFDSRRAARMGYGGLSLWAGERNL